MHSLPGKAQSSADPESTASVFLFSVSNTKLLHDFLRQTKTRDLCITIREYEFGIKEFIMLQEHSQMQP